MPSINMSVVTSTLLSGYESTAQSSPTPFRVEAFRGLMSFVRWLISPNSPSLEMSVITNLVKFRMSLTYETNGVYLLI